MFYSKAPQRPDQAKPYMKALLITEDPEGKRTVFYFPRAKIDPEPGGIFQEFVDVNLKADLDPKTNTVFTFRYLTEETKTWKRISKLFKKMDKSSW